MALEDFMEPEVGVAVALTAAVASPRVRGALRRGAVYGLAGLLMAGDAVSSLAKGVQRGAAQAVAKGKAPAVEGSPEETLVAAPKYVEVSQENAAESAEAPASDPPATHTRTRKASEAKS